MSILAGLSRALQINRHGVATNHQGRQRSWAEFADRVARFAAALRALGVEHETRVAILALNSDRYLDYYYAVPWAGGLVVPLNVRLAAPELIEILNDAGAEILIVDEAMSALLPALRAGLKSVRRVVLIDGGPPALDEGVALEAIIGAARPVEPATAPPGAPYGLFYTDGTTGRGKGVILTHAGITANAMNMIAEIGFDESSVYIHAGPMFHLADSAATFGVTMCGGSHVFVGRFDPILALETIQGSRATHSVMVPTMINMMVNSPAIATTDVSSLRLLMYGGAPMPEALLRQAMATLPGCGFLQAYGMTELSPVATFLSPDYHAVDGPRAGRLRSAGRAAHSVEIRIVDDQDREVPRGTVGEIVVRGPMVMQGYWQQPELTARTLRGGWMHTGDLASMDDEGFVFIVDRAKDMIITGGENVYSAEVENAVCQHPAVAMCAVIGIADAQWGERVHAVVVPKPGQTVTPDEIVGHCRSLVGGYKVPRSVEIRTEPMPISGAGKVLKTVLRAEHRP